MVFDITQLRKIRKKLDLTQNQFAKDCGISQSMVAKIESGKLDPTYSYVKKIETRVNSLLSKEEKLVGEIMIKKIISVKKNDSLEKVVSLLDKYGISQVPVIERGDVVGLITESELLDQSLKEKSVGEVMVESPPIVSIESPFSVIISLLKFYPVVLVKDKGKFVGLVTKADILHSLL